MNDAAVSHAVMRMMVQQYGSPIRESVLFGVPCVGNPQDWQDSTERLLPLLTHGLLKADSDTQGRILYSLVDDVELPEPSNDSVEPEPEADELYLREFNAERNTLENAEPRDPSELYIPISASLHWAKSGEFEHEK